MTINYIMAGVFLLLSIVFFSGRGGFLISGYNTASKAGKKRYKLRRLTRVMGIGMGVLALIMLTFGVLYEILPVWGFVLLGVAFAFNIVVMLVLANTYAKIKPGEEEDDV